MRLSMANKARVCVMLRTMKTSYESVERRFNSYLLTHNLHVRSTRAVAYDDINSSHNSDIQQLQQRRRLQLQLTALWSQLWSVLKLHLHTMQHGQRAGI